MKTKKGGKTKKGVIIARLDDLPELLTPEEAREVLRVSRNSMYELLRTGTVPSLKYGRLIRIRKAVLLEGGR
jgi:excisionase family DNA binding protein